MRRRVGPPSKTTAASWRRPRRFFFTLGLVLWAAGGALLVSLEPTRADEALRVFNDVLLEHRHEPAFVPNDVKPLLVRVGRPFQVEETENNGLRYQGFAKFTTWNESSLLRFNVAEGAEFPRLHFWGETSGVSLRIYPKILSAAAYRTKSDPAKSVGPDPVPYGELLATDDGRILRMPLGPMTIGVRNNAIVLYRGDIRMLTVPWEEPLKAVFIEAPTETQLLDFTLLSAGPAPKESVLPPAIVFEGARPAELAWKETLPEGSRSQKLENGGIELIAEKNATTAMLALPISKVGICSAVFQVEEATPGSGLVLLSANGEPIEGIEFGKEPKGRLAFTYGTPKERPNLDWCGLENRPIPLAGPGQWVRLVVGGGFARYWISSDGIHWGKVGDTRGRGGNWTSLALYAREKDPDPNKAAEPARRIRLKRLEIRELDGLHRVVPTDVLGKAATADTAMQANETLENWLTRVESLTPKGCALEDWIYASGLRVLAERNMPELLHRILRERLESVPSVEARVRMLQDGAMIDGILEEDANRHLNLWERLQLKLQGAASDEELRRCQVGSIEASVNFGLPRRGLLTATVVNNMLCLYHAEQKWQPIERLLKVHDYWRKGDPGMAEHFARQSLVEWIRKQTATRIAGNGPSEYDFRQPLFFQQNRSASEGIQNLLAVFDDKQTAEALRLYTSIAPRGDDGLVRVPKDELLLASLVNVKRIFAKREDFAAALAKPPGPAEQLTVDQILRQGNPQALERLEVQYQGTSYASAACQQLGDRVLATGNFLGALHWYKRGQATASAEQAPQLAARIRLASAGIGIATGAPITQPISFGATKLDPADIEKVVADWVEQNQKRAGVALPRETFPVIPTQATRRAKIALLNELNEGSYEATETIEILRGRDWSANQLVTSVHEDRLLVCKRRWLKSVSLASGETIWSMELGNSQRPFPIHPLVAGSKVFVRKMVERARYGIVCLDAATGRAQWLRDCDDNVIGDPLLIHGRLYAFAIRPSTWSDRRLNDPLWMIELDPETGAILARHEVGSASGVTQIPHECQANVLGNRIIVLFSGAVLCLDLEGRTEWARLSVAMPAEIDPEFGRQFRQPPFVSSGRIYYQQPGGCVVECVSPESGELLWRRGVPGLTKILYLNDKQMLVLSTNGPVMLNAETGEVLWKRIVVGIQNLVARNSAGQLLCITNEQFHRNGQSQLTMLWLDEASGSTLQSQVFLLPDQNPINLGTIAAGENKTLLIGGRGFGWRGTPNTMPIYELQPDNGGAEAKTP